MTKQNEVMKNQEDFRGRSLNANFSHNTAENVFLRKKIVVTSNHYNSVKSRSQSFLDHNTSFSLKDERQAINSRYKTHKSVQKMFKTKYVKNKSRKR